MTMVATPVADGTGGIHAGSGLFDILVDIAMSASYVTGGDTMDLTTIAKRGGGRGDIQMVLFEDLAGYTFWYDRTNKKILVYSTAATQIAAATYPAGLVGASVRAKLITR